MSSPILLNLSKHTASFCWLPLTTVLVHRLQVSGLLEGQWYSYRVRAFNKLGASRPSRATDDIQAVDARGSLLSCPTAALPDPTKERSKMRHCFRGVMWSSCSHPGSTAPTEPPEIQLDVKLLAGLTARAGTKIELPTDVKGKPAPRVKWTKADLVLRADERITIDTQPDHSKLSIANTTRGDTATYIIEAVNICGRATATIDVNILGTFCLVFTTLN